MVIKRYVALTVMIAAVSVAGSVRGEIAFYTDRDVWENDISGVIKTETFDEVTPYFLIEGINSAGLIDIEMVNLSEVNQWNSIDNGTDTEDFLSINGTTYYQGGCRLTDPDTRIDLRLPLAVGAFGADFTSTHSSSYGNGLVLQVHGVDYFFNQLLPDTDGTGFLGFITTPGTSVVTLFAPENNETFGLDNVSFVVPEPMTLILLSWGGWILTGRKKNGASKIK